MKTKIIFITFYIMLSLLSSCCIYDENEGYFMLNFQIVNQNEEDIFQNYYNIDSLELYAVDYEYAEILYIDTTNNFTKLNFDVFFDTTTERGGTEYELIYYLYLNNNDTDTIKVIFSLEEGKCSGYPKEAITVFYNKDEYNGNLETIFSFKKITNQ